MNKRTVMASLNKIANQLDIEGLHKEADTVTKVMSRLAYDDARDDYYDRMNEHMHDDYDDYESDESGSMEDIGYCPECEELTLIDGVCDQCGYGEDEGDMYGDDLHGHEDKDSDF